VYKKKTRVGPQIENRSRQKKKVFCGDFLKFKTTLKNTFLKFYLKKMENHGFYARIIFLIWLRNEFIKTQPSICSIGWLKITETDER